MFERQPEVLSGLEKAFKDYEQKNEKPSLIADRPGSARTVAGPFRPRGILQVGARRIGPVIHLIRQASGCHH
jgi:hypothetical protein